MRADGSGSAMALWLPTFECTWSPRAADLSDQVNPALDSTAFSKPFDFLLLENRGISGTRTRLITLSHAWTPRDALIAVWNLEH